MQKRRLEPMGLAKPGETHGLTGTGPGLACQESAGRVFGWFWNRTDPFLRSKPGLLAGYPDPLLTLVMSQLHYLIGCLCLSFHLTSLRVCSSHSLWACSSGMLVTSFWTPSPVLKVGKCRAMFSSFGTLTYYVFIPFLLIPHWIYLYTSRVINR